jgi:O-antigen/teichoic acid export membrane protein
MSNIKHTANYLIGNIGIKALGFISIPFFTHYLSVEEFGLMSLYSTVLIFLSTLLSLGMLGSFKRYYFENNDDFGAFLFSNILFLGLFFSSFVFLYFYIIQDISIFLDIPQDMLKYTIFISFLSLLVKVKLDFLQVQEHSKKNIILDFIQALVLLVFAISFMLYLDNNKFFGKIYGDMIGYGILAIYSMYKLIKIIEFKFDLKYIKYSLLFGLPVLPSMFSSFGLSFADRLMINKITDASDVGLYSFAFMIAMLLQVIISAVGKSWQPLFYKAMSNKDYKLLDNIFKINSKIVFGASLFLILFSYEFVYLLATSEYIKSLDIVLFLIIGFNFFFLYTAYGQYVSYSKKTYIDSIITITAVVLNIGLNYIYIPKYGYEASAITTIISYAFMFIMFYFNAKYFLKYRVINIFIISKIILSYFILLLVFLYINMIIDNYLVLLFIKFILINSYLIYNYWDNITQFKNEKKWLK